MFDQIPVGACGAVVDGLVANARSNGRLWRLVSWRGNEGLVSDLMTRLESAPVDCIDETTAVALVQPEWPMVVAAESTGCEGRTAVATLVFGDGDAALAAYVDDGGRRRLLAASFGLRSVCEAVWAVDPAIDIGCGTG